MADGLVTTGSFMSSERVWRSGVRFDCPECGKLWKDDADHAPAIAGGCNADFGYRRG